MQWALLPLSGYVLSVPSAFSLHRSHLSIPFAMSPLSRRVFADGFSPLRAVALAEGRLPVRWVPSEPLGVSGGSTYIALHRSWLVLRNFAVRQLELRSVFHTFSARRSTCIYGDHFVSLTDLPYILVYCTTFEDQNFHAKNHGSFITRDMFLGLLILLCS